MSEKQILIFLIQFLLLLGTAKTLGRFFEKIGQPTVTADILAGIIWGPSIFGRLNSNWHEMLFPVNDAVQSSMLETVAWLGILLMLLSTGLEVNFTAVWKQKSKAIVISLSDVIIPIIISMFFIYLLPKHYMGEANQWSFIIFLSVIMTISAMPVAIRAMQDLKLLKSDMGFLVLSCLSINDIIGWVIFTIILGLLSTDDKGLAHPLKIIFSTLIFTSFVLSVGRVYVGKLLDKISVNNRLNPAALLAPVVLLGLLFGTITQLIGIHALFGFFLAGLVAGDSKELSEYTKTSINHIVQSIFVPIFFASIGLKFDLFKHLDLFLAGYILIVGVLARYVGAYFGCFLAKTPKINRSAVSILHTPGGEMHIVICTLALQLGLISQRIFVAVIAAAIVSCITMGPWLSYVIKKRQYCDEPIQIDEAMFFNNTHIEERVLLIKQLCYEASTFCSLDEYDIENAVMAREELMSTAIGDAIAFPHARLKELEKPMILMATSEFGIEWDAPDNALVQLIFLILTPETNNDSQIIIYQKLSSFLSKPEIRDELLSCTNHRQLFKTFQKEFTKSE